MRPYRELIKHSAVYGLGQVLSRLASVLLLPFYTHHLRPSDYGAIAILDLMAGLLAVMLGTGMVAAVNRFHFEAETPRARRRLWWTGAAFVLGTATAVVLPALAARDGLAPLLLGSGAERGALWCTLALATAWCNLVAHLPESYVRVRKWSGLSVALSLLRLMLNIGLNVWFLAGLGWGVEGILWGNLATAAAMAVVYSAVLCTAEPPGGIDLRLLRRLLGFGAPFMATSALSLLMHQADRGVLRLFVGLEELGVYSLAYQVGQGVNTLCLLPFAAIWSVLVYEIAAQPDARLVYARVFEWHVKGLALVMLGVSLFAGPLLSALTAADYAGAADLVPVICLAYLFFSLHEHFRVPVMLHKRTPRLIPVFAAAAGTNVAANLALIPLAGSSGAAWASVVTFSVFSFLGLWAYRGLDRYPYRLGHCAAVVGGMAATYAGCRGLGLVAGPGWSAAVAALAWALWAFGLFGSAVRHRISWPAARTRRRGQDEPLEAVNAPARPG